MRDVLRQASKAKCVQALKASGVTEMVQTDGALEMHFALWLVVAATMVAGAAVAMSGIATGCM